MNIVIAGAGDVGFNLTELLAVENQSITLIENNPKVLEYAEHQHDVLGIFGDTTSLDILQKANVENAHLFIAATTNETTNLLASILAKKLGAKKTIARVSKEEYLTEDTRSYFATLGIDNLVSPRLLAAEEINRLISRSSATDSFQFEDGLISVMGFTIDNSSPLANKTVKELEVETPEFLIRTICILRNGKTIVPGRDEVIMRSDHLYVVTNNQNFSQINTYIGKTLKRIRKIMIIGGSPLAHLSAKMLENDFRVKLVVKDEERCKELHQLLQKALIINGDWTDINLLREEGLNEMDAFIALTDNAETNIINCITAENEGVYKTIALVDNSAYTQVSFSIGVDTLINKKLLTANNIFRYVRKGKVQAIASLHGVDGEIIEFEIHKNNRVVKVPLCELKLTANSAKIIGVVRNGTGIIPDDDFQLKIGDKVIVFALQPALKKVESIFR